MPTAAPLLRDRPPPTPQRRRHPRRHLRPGEQRKSKRSMTLKGKRGGRTTTLLCAEGSNKGRGDLCWLYRIPDGRSKSPPTLEKASGSRPAAFGASAPGPGGPRRPRPDCARPGRELRSLTSSENANVPCLGRASSQPGPAGPRPCPASALREVVEVRAAKRILTKGALHTGSSTRTGPDPDHRQPMLGWVSVGPGPSGADRRARLMTHSSKKRAMPHGGDPPAGWGGASAAPCPCPARTTPAAPCRRVGPSRRA